MRDTNDMMEDAVSEDTMMECGGGDDDGGLDDLVYLATDIADSAPTVRDAAERLLTLLGVDGDDDDDDDDDVSSSEDEGVEVDVDESDAEEENREDTRILHLLAASLAQELKYTKQSGTNSKVRQVQVTSQAREAQRNAVQSMDVGQDSIDVDKDCLRDREVYDSKCNVSRGSFRQYEFSSGKRLDSYSSDATCLDSRLGDTDDLVDSALPSSWGAGWDACASEALRYLIEDEGLPPHHPTVVAMKGHLELQREQRAFVQYTA